MSPGLFQSSLPANYPEVSIKDYLNSKLQAKPAAAGYSLLRENYERPLWFRFDTRSFSDTDPSERRLRAPGKLADGFAISRDTDLAALFR